MTQARTSFWLARVGLLAALAWSLSATQGRAQTETFKAFLTGLPAASAPAGTETIPCLQSAITSGCTPNLLWQNVNQLIVTGNSTTTTPAASLTGTWFTGGNATTTTPHFLIQPTGATSNAWNTSGTGLGVNAASGFAGLLADFQLNGVSKANISSVGTVTLASAATLNWNSDLFISRNAAAKFLIGGASASGTNTVATGPTIIANLSTGNATNPDLILQTGVKTVSGQTLATPTTALTIKGETQNVVIATTLAAALGSQSTEAITFNNITNGTGVGGIWGTQGVGTNGTINFGDSAILGTVGGFHIGSSTAGVFGLIMRGTSMIGWAPGSDTNAAFDTMMGRSAAATIQFGSIDAASPVAQTLQVQSVITGTSNTAGANLTINGSKSTGNAAGGKVIIQGSLTGSSGTMVNSAFPMISANPGSAGGFSVQFGDGTNFTTYDSCTALTTGATGVIACTASALRFKTLRGMVTAEDALSGLDKLRTGAPVWDYKGEYKERFGEGLRVGLIADDVEAMDKRCVTYDQKQLKDYRDRCVIAYLVAAVQKLNAEVTALRRQRK